jgi:hypothetical protein
MTDDTLVEGAILDEDSLDADSLDENDDTSRWRGVALAGLLSLGAGAVHAAAAGLHSEHPQLARIFVAMGALQIALGLIAILRPGRLVAAAVVAVNAAAVGGWLMTRMTGISWVDGLEQSEAPQFADTACAALGAGAIVVALAVLAGWRRSVPKQFVLPGLAIAALTVPAMMFSVTHVHAHGEGGDDHSTAADGAHDHAAADASGAVAPAALSDDAAAHDESGDHAHDDSAAAADPAQAGHDHADSAAAADPAQAGHDHAAPAVVAGAAPWPRPWDPAEGLDVSGVEGVTLEQQARAEQLVADSLRELPKYADPATAVANGYASIGDAGTGSEHFIRGDLIGDDVILDATAPESLVYNVVGDQKTLAGAMYIASERPSDDPTLTDYAGSLMTWHKHDNLCWDQGDDGKAKVVGIIDDAGNCARGVRGGNANPMVHVWITPHPCGVFAALEGVGAGSAAVPESERVDMCSEEHAEHDPGGASAAAPPPKAYDPALPIDLSGTPGVTPQQQAAAENLIAINVVDLPQWSDYSVAEAAGFRSIGDGGRPGAHEHFIKWEWINDDVTLDPDAPESLVYEVQADGSRKLVSAMYMLPNDVGLDEVPDIGGPLMQWHVHENLCFSSDPAQPRVAGITDEAGNCREGLKKFDPSAMIHVWITPHKCGPFAALEGVGAGQILEGQERLCDTAHGAH